MRLSRKTLFFVKIISDPDVALRNPDLICPLRECIVCNVFGHEVGIVEYALRRDFRLVGRQP
jgi:hypothetical protein